MGASGLEADQKVIAAHGCYAMTATAALTAQNTQGVYGIHEIPSNFVQKQINACVDDIGVDVLKTGMLATQQTIAVVANAIREHQIPVSIVDPVRLLSAYVLFARNFMLTAHLRRSWFLRVVLSSYQRKLSRPWLPNCFP